MTEEKKITKRPTAQKRQIQSEKRRLANRSFKSTVRSAVRKFEETVQAKSQELAQAQLNEVYSLMDKAVKRGVFKLNKASRTKARLAVKAATI
jgi:small subunit ribosomal protein S20